jgi:hypothetical protein
MITSCLIVHGMKNVSDGICGEYQEPHFIFNIFPPANGAVYEIMCKNTVEPGSPLMTI